MVPRVNSSLIKENKCFFYNLKREKYTKKYNIHKKHTPVAESSVVQRKDRHLARLAQALFRLYKNRSLYQTPRTAEQPHDKPKDVQKEKRGRMGRHNGTVLERQCWAEVDTFSSVTSSLGIVFFLLTSFLSCIMSCALWLFSLLYLRSMRKSINFAREKRAYF